MDRRKFQRVPLVPTRNLRLFGVINTRQIFDRRENVGGTECQEIFLVHGMVNTLQLRIENWKLRIGNWESGIGD